jgi:hypothetical protein
MLQYPYGAKYAISGTGIRAASICPFADIFAFDAAHQGERMMLAQILWNLQLESRER